MAHTVTWPRALHGRAGKQARAARRRREQALAGKGPLGRALEALRGVFAGTRGRPVAGEYALQKGAWGEQAVAEELDRLPDGWYIVNDIRVAGSQIDHVVLGPKGIFCIETKHAGTVRVDEAGHFYRLERRMWVPAGSPAAQNMRHIQSLRNLLRDQFDFHPRLHSVVVFVGSGRYELETLTVPPGRTRIAFLTNLNKYLQAQPDVSWNTGRRREMALAIAGRKNI